MVAVASKETEPIANPWVAAASADRACEVCILCYSIRASSEGGICFLLPSATQRPWSKGEGSWDPRQQKQSEADSAQGRAHSCRAHLPEQEGGSITSGHLTGHCALGCCPLQGTPVQKCLPT